MSVVVPLSLRGAARAACCSTLLLMATFAAAECPGPATLGIRICYPSPNSTVTYPATLEIGANPSTAIVAVRVYDNNKQIFTNQFLPNFLTDGGVYNGAHHIVVNAFDASGHLYQASANFTVVGFGYGFCRAAAVGVNICTPSEGQFVPDLGVPITMKANPASAAKITTWRMYLDNKLVMTSQPDFSNYVNTGIGVSAGSHRLVINAWDASGRLYRAARKFTAFYEYDCNPKNGACTPGIEITSPANVGPFGSQDVPSQFQFQAETRLNPLPITKMQVALDGKIVATGTGPGITTEMHPAPGSHIVSVTSWDTAGKMYASYGTINVQ